jgi:hypothetical protein
MRRTGRWIWPAGPDAPGRLALDRAAMRSAAAALWTEALERTVAVEAEPCPAQGLPASPLDAVVGFLWAGEACQLHVPCHLLVDRLRPLAGLRSALVAEAPAPGPLPLTAAEEGLLAWLAMGWFSLLPQPRPVFAWVAGPTGEAAPPPGPTGAVLWRVTVDTAPAGLVRWLVGVPALPHGADAAPEAVELCPLTAPVVVDWPVERLRPGDLVLLEPGPWPLLLTLPDHRVMRATLCGEALLLGPRVSDPLDAAAHQLRTPRALQVALAPLRTTFHAAMAFGPGSRLPVPDGGLRATIQDGRRGVAAGRLVELGGRLALELDEVGGRIDPNARPGQSS